MKACPQCRTSVFLVDDHPLIRQGLKLVLEQGGSAVGGEADGIQATLDHPGLASAQVVLLDISLERASGVDLIPEVCRRGLRVVVYSMHEDPAVVRRALAAGATGTSPNVRRRNRWSRRFAPWWPAAATSARGRRLH